MRDDQKSKNPNQQNFTNKNPNQRPQNPTTPGQTTNRPRPNDPHSGQRPQDPKDKSER
jgi:hypothetical protein